MIKRLTLCSLIILASICYPVIAQDAAPNGNNGNTASLSETLSGLSASEIKPPAQNNKSKPNEPNHSTTAVSNAEAVQPSVSRIIIATYNINYGSWQNPNLTSKRFVASKRMLYCYRRRIGIGKQ